MPIPYDIDYTERVAVLSVLGTESGASALDITASYPTPDIVGRINAISAAANTAGADPPLPIYSSIDHNAFTSIMMEIDAALVALGEDTETVGDEEP